MNRLVVAKELLAIAREIEAYGRPSVSVDELADYESGFLSEEQVIDLFQRLVDNGMVWQLQGNYGRIAMDMIRQGLVKR